MEFSDDAIATISQYGNCNGLNLQTRITKLMGTYRNVHATMCLEVVLNLALNLQASILLSGIAELPRREREHSCPCALQQGTHGWQGTKPAVSL